MQKIEYCLDCEAQIRIVEGMEPLTDWFWIGKSTLLVMKDQRKLEKLAPMVAYGMGCTSCRWLNSMARESRKHVEVQKKTKTQRLEDVEGRLEKVELEFQQWKNSMGIGGRHD